MYEMVLGKVADKLLDRFAGRVIRRWSQYRAERFFRALVEGLAEGSISEQKAVERVDAALEDEVKSESLFEAYRRVCLSASRDIGPRLIGLLTAKILSEGRMANQEEEQLFMATETLSDAEFSSLLEFLRETSLRDEGEPRRDRTILVESHSEHQDSSLPGGKIDISPLNLGESYGSWALKAAAVGIIVQRIVQDQREYRADSERHIDEDDVVTSYIWLIGFDSALLDYLDLIALSARESTQER